MVLRRDAFSLKRILYASPHRVAFVCLAARIALQLPGRGRFIALKRVKLCPSVIQENQISLARIMLENDSSVAWVSKSAKAFFAC
jgi:hypothetical protein